MVAPSPHSTSVIGQRMRKRIQKGTKTPIAPAEENTVSTVLNDGDTPVTHKKKTTNKSMEQKATENDNESNITLTDENILLGNRRIRRATPSVYKTPTRNEKQAEEAMREKQNEEIEKSPTEENLQQKTPKDSPQVATRTRKREPNGDAENVDNRRKEEMQVRRSPRSRPGSVDSVKSVSSEESTPLIKQIHAKKLKELQAGDKTVENSDISSRETHTNVMENSTPHKTRKIKEAMQQEPTLSSQKKLKETNRESPVPSPKIKRLKEVSQVSPIRKSPRTTKRKEQKTSKGESGAEEEEDKDEIIIVQAAGTGAAITEERQGIDMESSKADASDAVVEDDIEIVRAVDADVVNDASEDEFLDASAELQDDEEEFVDAAEVLTPSEPSKVTQPEIIEISDNSSKPQSQDNVKIYEEMEITTPTDRKTRSRRITTKTPTVSVNKGTREEGFSSGRKETPKDSPQVARLNRRRIDSDDEEDTYIGPIPEIGGIMSNFSESPQKNQKRDPTDISNEDKQEAKHLKKPENQSPRTLKRRTKNMIETSEDESANEETPNLRRSRRTHKDSPLLKEINSTDGTFASPTRKKKHEDTAAKRPAIVVIGGEGTPKDSPQFARLRNRRIIESSDEESAAEETPESRRKRRGQIQSTLVKAVENSEIDKLKTPDLPVGTKITARESVKKQATGKEKIQERTREVASGIGEKGTRRKVTKTEEVQEEEEDDVEKEQNEISGSDDSLEQFKTQSQKVDTEITLNYKSPSPAKVDREVTLNIGRDSPNAATPLSASRSSSRIGRRNTPQLSPFVKDTVKGKSGETELSPTRICPRHGEEQAIPKSPPRNKHSEIEELWEHTPKGHYGRWKKPGPLLYKIPSPPHVPRVAGVDDSSSPAKKTDPKSPRTRGPAEELFARSPRILRASKASPSQSRAVKESRLETSALESPKTTPRSTRRTRQTSGAVQTDSPGRRTPKTNVNDVTERRTLRSPAVRTPNSNR